MYDLDPSAFYLSQNHPNPFKDKTTIKYCVAYRTNVKITVFNYNGEMIITLVDEEKEAGTYEIEFNATELQEEVYFYKIQADGYKSTKRLILLR